MEVELKICCLTCKNKAVAYETKAPDFLVSGLVIAFHSRHEGHILEVIVDGVSYVPG